MSKFMKVIMMLIIIMMMIMMMMMMIMIIIIIIAMDSFCLFAFFLNIQYLQMVSLKYRGK